MSARLLNAPATLQYVMNDLVVLTHSPRFSRARASKTYSWWIPAPLLMGMHWPASRQVDSAFSCCFYYMDVFEEEVRQIPPNFEVLFLIKRQRHRVSLPRSLQVDPLETAADSACVGEADVHASRTLENTVLGRHLQPSLLAHSQKAGKGPPGCGGRKQASKSVHGIAHPGIH